MFAKKHLLCSLLILSVMGLFQSIKSEDCNESICGSVVSKCLLTQSCQCKLTNCFCCQDCVICLGKLFSECCRCLQMCPKDNNTLTSDIGDFKSEVGDFEGLPELFNALTAEDDDQWTSIRFPMSSSLQRPIANLQTSAEKLGSNSINCTVIFLNTCITSKKCSQYCESMGSNSYRWFHNGCCECVGANCYNYGINESRCTACPDDDEDEKVSSASILDEDKEYGDESEDNIFWDYGDEEMDYN